MYYDKNEKLSVVNRIIWERFDRFPFLNICNIPNKILTKGKLKKFPGKLENYLPIVYKW